MNKLLEQMESYITKAFPEGNAIRSRYHWAKERFELEYKEEAITQERLAKFLSQVWCDGSFAEEKLEKRLDEHLEYLAKLEKDEDKIDQEWKKSPKEFVTKLANYRANGMMDSNLSKQLLDFAKNINNDPLRYIYEIIQNADDCDYITETPEITISLEHNSTIEVYYNEVGMRYTDVLAITTIGQSNKQNRIKKRIIGEKGIGFKTIFSVCESVDIWSGGYSFALHDNNFVPKYLEENKESKESKENQGTTLHLHLKSKTETETENATLQINAQKVFDNLKEKYGFSSEGKDFCAQNAFQNCPILFTNRLHAITIRKGEESFSIKKNENNDEGAILYFINDKKVGEIGYFRITRDVTFEYTEYCSRYKDQFQDGSVYTKAEGEVKTYPLEIVAAKDATSIEQGCVYSYLPTSTKIKAPFNIQIPAKLNLDRSCIYFIGDSDTNSQQQSQVNTDNPETIAWNERLMKELFFSANPLIQEFYDILIKKKTDIFLYIPTFENNNHQLFAGDEKYSAAIKNLNTYCGKRDLFKTFQNIPYFKVDDNKYCTAEQAVMFDEFIDRINFNTYYYDRLKADDQLKEKAYLVEYHPNAVEKTKCFGFDLYSIREKQKAEYMNETLEKTNWENIEIIQKEVVNSDNRSKYISEDVLQLRIFPTYNKDEGVQYRSYKNSSKNNFWFQEVDDCKIYSNGQICIFAKKYWKATQLPKEVELPEQTSENIWDKVFQKQIGKDLFEELIDLLFRMNAFEGYSKESWQKAIEQFLKGCEKENTDFWVKEANDGNDGDPRMKQLAIFLQKNASKFANKVGETE